MLERLSSEIRYRLRALLRRRAVERELDEELAFHLARETEKLVQRGLTASDAARATRLAFGGVDRIKEASRDARGIRWLDGMSQDVKHAVRQLTANPGFATVVVVTLALGIGANAALFTILDRLFFRPPAGVVAPDELFRLYRHQPPGERSSGFVTEGFPYPAIMNIAGALPAGVQIATYWIASRALGRGESAPVTTTVMLGPGYFELLGVRPALGRLPTLEETRVDDGAAVAVISHHEWLHRYGGDPGVLGRQVELLYQPYTVIGVLPRGFTGIDVAAADYWIPLGANQGNRRDPRHSSWNYGGTHVIVRAGTHTREGVAAIASAVAFRGAPAWLAAGTVSAASLKAALGPQQQPGELGVATRLGAVAAILLLIACANVANLNLARAVKRRQEIAVRLALGISRARLIAMLATETLILAVLAGFAALLVALWGGDVLRRTLFPDITWHGSPLDVRVALFALTVAATAGLLAGLPPALRAGKFGLATALKAGARDGASRRSRLGTSLVSVQTGLSVVLLVAAGAFIKSLGTVTAIDVGFDADRLALVSMAFSDRENHDAELKTFMPQVMERLRTVPQVEAVATSSERPLSEWVSASLFDEGGRELEFVRELPSYQVVSPDFFETMGMRLVAGRAFGEEHRDAAVPVIVINRTMAADLWPDRSPLGECIRILTAESTCASVIGVVETAHRNRLIEPTPAAHYYRSLRQVKNPLPAIAVVRARPGELASVIAAARTQIRQDLPAGAFPDVQPLAERFDRELRPWRLGAALFSALGFLALLVAAIGTYSVIAYLVHQRKHELGVRMALGARGSDLAGLVVTDALRMVGIGLVVGVAAALAFGGLLDSLLYETSPRDPAVTALVALLLVFMAGAAAVLPAWRATRVDPTVALRSD